MDYTEFKEEVDHDMNIMYTYDIFENETAKIRVATDKDIDENLFSNLDVLIKQLTDEHYTIIN